MCQDAETPLIKATKMRNMEIVELLLDKGAKVSAVDKVSLCVCVYILSLATLLGYQLLVNTNI